MLLFMRMPAPGEVFEGKYQIHEALGRGGFATVFRATDTEIQRDVAIKVLAPRDGEYPGTLVARFMVEARAIAGLQDPHTIRLFEFGESSEGLLYMVFQYVAGLDLAELLQRRGRLAPDVVIHVTKQVLMALAEAHAAGVLHRDLKPANILIHDYMGDEFSAKLLDFGIAKIDADQLGGPALTKAGTLLGTPRYMSPEQVFGEPLAPSSDIYSLGLLAFEMLVGRPAIEGTQEEILKKQVSETPLFVPPDVGWNTLRRVIERMLVRDPAQRYRQAVDVIAALDFARQHRVDEVVPVATTQAPHLPPRERQWSSGTTYRPPTNSAEVARRRGRGRLMMAGAVALCVAVGALGVYLKDQARPAKPRVRSALPNALLETRAAPPRPEVSRPDVGPQVEDLGVAEDMNVDDEIIADGCGKPLLREKKMWVKLSGAGFSRTARLFVPSKYDAEKRYPLVITLQPKYNDEDQYAGRSGLQAIATARGQFILLAVTADNKLNPWVSHGDIPVLKDAVRAVSETLCVDRSHVYAVGHGAGGRMARKLACAMPLSGIAVSGNSEPLPDHSCEASPPVPMLFVAAEKDSFVPLDGGEGCDGHSYLSAAAHDDLWKTRNGCGGEPTLLWSNSAEGRCEVWEGTSAAYASCRAKGGHHVSNSNWALLDAPGCSSPPLAMVIGPAVWKFFKKYGRALD